MKNIPKLSFLAPLVLQALLLFMSFSAIASAGDEQEIGVPHLEARAKGCFGVVLSPDENGFYSLRDGLLTHYQIDPFKKLGSIAIDLEQLNDIPDKSDCRVLITDDRSKLILVFPGWLVSLDRITGKIIKKIERIGELKRASNEAVTINENELVILSRLDEGQGWYFRAWFYLSVLDVNTFRYKRPAPDIFNKFEFAPTDCCTGMHITQIKDRLYLSSGKTLAVLSSKTYEPELTLSCEAPLSFGSLPMISSDYRTLYASCATLVHDYILQTRMASSEPMGNKKCSVLIFDQDTRKFDLKPHDDEKEKEHRLRRDVEPFLFGSGSITRNDKYVSLSQWSRAILASRTTGVYYFFYQYDSGEAILERVRYPDRAKTYQLTPGARQNLMMRNRAGKTVPINDATFQKLLGM